MLYRITNKSAVDGVNVEMAGQLSYIGPGEHADAEIGQIEAAALPETAFDVEDITAGNAEAAQGPGADSGPAAAAVTPDPPVAPAEAPTDSNVGS